jgi:hypothetical protein
VRSFGHKYSYFREAGTKAEIVIRYYKEERTGRVKGDHKEISLLDKYNSSLLAGENIVV